ncbi:uncharacterized protein LOC117657304, partial [Pantherophis guttatus]|uniref:Uncharacterized protein LOC117657304 n=1 Tax=Pantherophis guttatus TaxID=94885 RepID=A0ABM3YYG9_PANGU
PWDESLSDDMEEMKLILHMWLALFYSKPLRALTVRKVVEHSNPAKYVSLNSLVDPLEPMDDAGGPCGLEKRPASSLPEAVQIPAEGGEDGSVSPSEKLLPGNRLSSTDSLEDESPLTTLEEIKDLLQKKKLSHPPLKSVDEVVEAEPKEQTSLHPVLPIENPPGIDERVNSPICQTDTGRSQETMSVETSPNDASVPTGLLAEGSRNQQPIASTEVAVSVANRGTDVESSSEEVKKDNLPAGDPDPRTWKEAELKADVRSREPTNPGNKVQNQPRLRTDERDGESVDLGSIDLVLSKSNDADLEIQDMDLVSEDEGDPAESSVKGREETDGMSNDSSGQGPLSSRASSPDALSGHPTEFPGIQEAAVEPSSSSVSPNQMELMDMVPQQKASFHPVTVDEKMVGSTSSSVSPNQMGLMALVPQQKASFHPVTVDEKMVGSTSSSVSPNQMGLMALVPQQEISFHPVTVDEKMVGSTSSSVSPNQMELMDMVPQQKASFHPVTVDEKMVASTSSSVSPNQMELMDTVPQQKASFHPVTVDEKMVGSTSSSVSPNQMRLMDMVPQQEISFHPVTVDEKMVESTSSSVSPNQMELMALVPQQEISFHPVTVDEKMVGSTSSSVSPNQMELMDTVPQQKASFHPVTVDEKMVGSTSSSVSPNQMELMDMVPQQKASFHPVTVDEKMVESTSSSVSPNQLGLMVLVPQQKASFHPVTVDEKMVGSTSSSVSPNQMELMDMVPQQKALFHPVTVDEKMVGSTSSSVSPNQMELMALVPQQEISFHPVTVDEKMVGSTSSSVSPNQMELMDTVPQQKASFHPVTVDEKMVGSTSSSVSPNQMGLMDTVPQQDTSFHPVTVDEKMVGSAMDPTSPKQTDEVENSHNEAILANSASTEASGDFPNNLATPDGPFHQSPQEPVESPRVPNQVDVVDLSSVSQEDGRIRSSCLPSWQASPVHQGASDEEPPRIQEDRPEDPLYHIFQNPMGLIEDISQDSTDLGDPVVLHLCEPNDNLCVNSVPNSISTRQESVENQDTSVAFAQRLPLTKEMDLIESPEGDHPASPVHQETSDEAATLQDDSGAKLDLLEDSPIPQEKDVIHPIDDVLGRVNEPRLAESDLGTQEEQKISQGEKIPVDSQPAKEYPSLESHDAESETSFKSETCLDQENIRDFSAREEEEASPDDGVEKPTITTTAVAEEVHVLMNELVDTVCATIAQSEEMRAPKSLDWIDSAMLESVTPPVSDDEGCPTDQDPHADVTWAEECLEESSSFDDQEEDLQARVEGQGELGSSSNENTTSDPGDASEKAELQGNDATSAAMEAFSSCGTSQAELDTTSPKSRCSCLKTTESPDDYSAKADDYSVSTLEKVGQTEASPEEPICNREDYSRGEDVGNLSFVPAKCQEDSLAEEPGSLVDRDSNETPEDREEEAQEETKGCLGSLEDPLPDERTQMSTSSSGTDTDWEDESLTVDGGQDPCVDWYPKKTLESWCQPRFKASPSIESELTRSSGPGNDPCKDGDWVSSEASQKTSDARSMKRNVPFGLKKDCLWSRDMDHKPEPFKDYINFSITKKHKEKSRTFHAVSKEHNPFSRDLGSINSWSRNCGFLSDPIQNILDVESLQFHCRIQGLLKRSQRSTSRVLPSKKVPLQRIAERWPSRTVSEETNARFPTRSKSPLLVTVVNPNPRTGRQYDNICRPFPASLDPFVPAAVPKSQGGLGPKSPFPSLHLQKLTYHKLNSFSRDISSVLEDFAEFSRAMNLESTRTCNPGRDLTATSGKAGEIRYPPRPPTPLVYEDLLADLRNALHFQLKNVAQEACRKPFSFYLMETEDDPFFGRVKNLLRKGGHSEVDLLQFCKGSGMETENLMVIVRNEDIFLHIHKVPFLLRLKRCPNVTFAGLDRPEDSLDHTYQELFHSGGFVVSDDNVLAGMTIGELKDVIKTLEKLNGHGRWKWFLHYRESKKLKEDARGDPAAYTKESVLKSCQVANMTEVLHYHKCDSRSCTRFERFNCLLNLQIQHITKRFGVFLTENASANREALEDKGIFGLNITDFIAIAQGLVAPFGSGFW